MRVYIVLVKVCEKTHSKSLGKEFRGSLAIWPESRSDSCNLTWKILFKFQHVLASHVAFSRVGIHKPVAS